MVEDGGIDDVLWASLVSETDAQLTDDLVHLLAQLLVVLHAVACVLPASCRQSLGVSGSAAFLVCCRLGLQGAELAASLARHRLVAVSARWTLEELHLLPLTQAGCRGIRARVPVEFRRRVGSGAELPGPRRSQILGAEVGRWLTSEGGFHTRSSSAWVAHRQFVPRVGLLHARRWPGPRALPAQGRLVGHGRMAAIRIPLRDLLRICRPCLPWRSAGASNRVLPLGRGSLLALCCQLIRLIPQGLAVCDRGCLVEASLAV